MKLDYFLSHLLKIVNVLHFTVIITVTNLRLLFDLNSDDKGKSNNKRGRFIIFILYINNICNVNDNGNGKNSDSYIIFNLNLV